MRFSQASGDVIEGSRPRSCLNFRARLASSRASSIVRLMRLPAITACDLLQALLAHGLGEDGVGFAEGVDPVDQVDVQIAHVHGELADALDERGVRVLLALALGSPQGDLLGLLREVEGGDGVLAHRFLILFVQFGVLVLDDLAHADLGQLLRHQLLIEQTALDGSLVLDEGGDDLVEVLLADALRLLALRRDKALDLDLETARSPR